ncbi:hypothetical protein HK104_000649, partial [Borealophlyctis nickersoniae]
MDSFLWLLFLSISMLSGSFLAGNIPLAFQFSEERLNLVSTFGSGMLVGTALIVIIPEGVETLYSVQSKLELANKKELHYPQVEVGKEEQRQPADTGGGRQVGPGNEEGAPKEETAGGEEEFDARRRKRRRVDSGEGGDPSTEASLTRKDGEHLLPRSSRIQSQTSAKAVEPFEAHKYIGPALAIGFAFMFLVDHAGQSHGHSHHIVAVNEFEFADTNVYKEKKVAATIGLVVHAAADGIALGAASASEADGATARSFSSLNPSRASITDRGSLEFIVFIAIMLHKAPSAFGLATFLLHEGHSRRVVRQHLLIFSLAAPIAAILTYGLLQQGTTSGTGSVDDPAVMQKWTGILLLFSAGTFLYVATIHILPEIYNSVGKGGG